MSLILNGTTGIVPANLSTGGPAWDASGNLTVASGNLTVGSGNLTIGGKIIGATQGVTDGSDAAAGNVGYFISVNVPVASEVTLTNNVPATIVTMNLPAGDWMVNGQVNYDTNGSTPITVLKQGISFSTGSFGAVNTYSVSQGASYTPTAADDIGQLVRSQRISVTGASPTPIYLVALANFASGTLKAYGILEARRVR
jgi:hypothetical protein